MKRILVGTEDGLHEVGAPTPDLGGGAVTALASAAGTQWAIVDRRTLLCAAGHGWEQVTQMEKLRAHCLLAADGQLLVGTSEAHLYDVAEGALVPSFEAIETRDQWYTPWGGPPDTRSIARHPGGALFVNVHVGGVWRADGSERGWREVVEVDDDTHQVCADEATGVVAVAAAVGYGQSDDGGNTWSWTAEGLHASYCRAVAIAGSTVLLTASTGPFTDRAALYRRPLGDAGAFERCRDGLPEWFGANVDTGCLAADGPYAAFGTHDGEVYASADEGASWEMIASDLPPVHAIAVA